MERAGAAPGATPLNSLASARALGRLAFDTQCDEYPFYTGDNRGPTPGYTDQLMLINADQNGLEGTQLQGLYEECGLTVDPKGSPSREY